MHFVAGANGIAPASGHACLNYLGSTMRPMGLLGFAQPLSQVANFASLHPFWSRQCLSSRTWTPLHHHQPSFFALLLASMGRKKSQQKFYAVHKGLNGFRGVVEDWPTCQRKVNGVPGAVFKSFTTRAEAVVFCEVGRGQTSDRPGGASVTFAPSKEARLPRTSVPHLNSSVAIATRKPSFFIDRSPGNTEASTSVGKRKVVVYTDGACSNNGKPSAKAGVGVYFGPDDELNVSEKLAGETQTNQRAEQTGVLRAMQLALSMGRVGPGDTLCIKTDSNYTVKGLLSWMPGWKKRDWKSSTGSDVLNQDLWQELDAAKTALEHSGVILDLIWVKGHAGEPGNEAADRLAVSGVSV